MRVAQEELLATFLNARKSHFISHHGLGEILKHVKSLFTEISVLPEQSSY